MRPFRFSLQAVRTLRQRKEQQALEVYALALHAQRETCNHLHQVRNELESAWRQWNSALCEESPVALISQARSYFQAVEVRYETCAEAVERAERRAREALRAMLLARQLREGVDTFFRNRRRGYDRQVQLEERKGLDELAQRRASTAIVWSPAKPVTDV